MCKLLNHIVPVRGSSTRKNEENIVFLGRFMRNTSFNRPLPPSEVKLKPIGWVRNNIEKPQPNGWENIKSTIEIESDYEKHLARIEEYSHIILICYLDLAADAPTKPTQIKEIGIFATRSQLRPNHLAVSSVRLLGRTGNNLKVQGLDSINGTPVLDIKPYLPFYDSFDDAQIPEK